MKVYIAAPYPLKERAARMARVLALKGIEVTSRWLTQPNPNSDAGARMDLEDIAAADALLALNPEGWEEKGTGGRHVELGYALALGKPILLVGERSNIFHHLTSVVQVDEIADFTKHVQTLGADTCDVFTPERAIALVVREFLRASRKHKPMNSPHEGWAVIAEELDELWDEVKADRGRAHSGLEEAIHVSAMGLRYVLDMARQAVSTEPNGTPAADAIGPRPPAHRTGPRA